MTYQRPDPDQLLRVVSKELKEDGRGRLKIFFAACSGAGKTSAMLSAAQGLIEKGVKVSVGVLETHDREEVMRLLGGLPQIPLRAVDYQGHLLRDFDLDAALASGSELVLVDELAHANPPGSRHTKRWGDVEELLAAGIDVYTTLNVQHLESLADIVSGIIGVPVRETVPDRIFTEATEVTLIDLSPDDLLARLDAGKVHVTGTLEQARQNFFQRANLVALRELALRHMADRINADVQTYRLAKSATAVWPTRERLMVCVGGARGQERLIAEGARIAQRLHADCLVAHVQTSHENEADREYLRALARHAETIKAEFLSVAGDDIAATLLDLARTNNVTKLIVGHGSGRWHRLWRRELFEQIARANPELSILLVATLSRPRPAKPPLRWNLEPFPTKSLLITTAACGLTTLIAMWLYRFFDTANLLALFMLAVVVVALKLGRAAAIWGALLSAALFDFFFVPPLLSFAMSDTQYLFTFALMLVIALVASEVGMRLRADARNARAGERREAAVARVARDLSGALEAERILTICTETIAPLFEANVSLILPDLHERLRVMQPAGFEDLSVAQWAYDHAQRTGHGTDTLNAAQALYLPLKAPIQCRGVLAIQPRDWRVLEDPDEKRLLEASCSSIALALERVHFARIAQETLVRMEGERLRNSLLSTVSHDLRTPLTAIRGLAETLADESALSHSSLEIATAIRNQAQGLQQVVTNLLDLARMQSAGVRLNKEWHALDEIVGSALSRLAPVLGGRQLLTRLPDDLPLLDVDASLIERVLFNLLDNAIKYTSPDAQILIGADVADDSVCCFVEDRGPGLPSGDPESLFAPFARGQKESAISGVGLGLALCRSIVEAHGGTIQARAAEPSGTRFEICFALGSPPPLETEVAA